MTQPSILLVAGEASADAHGAQVIAALEAQYGPVDVFGIGGPACEAQGMDILVRAQDMSLAGITEVLWALPRMVRTLWRLVRAARERRPVVAVLLDLPDFNLPLAKRIKKLGIPVVYYISPQVWAWRAGRVRHIRRWVDKMLVILPFEEAYYRARAVDAEFVGHPLTEHVRAADNAQDQTQQRQALQIESHAGQVLALLPGSRNKEVLRHLPTMLAAVKTLRASENGPLTVLIPTASTIDKALIVELVAASGEAAMVLQGGSQAALRACDVAMVCSGTATLEAALIGRPMVVVYRVSPLSFFILRRLVRVAHIALVNLIAQERLVPELVQGAFTARALAHATAVLLRPGDARRLLTQRLQQLRHTLSHRKPSLAVARAIQHYLPARQGQSGSHHG